MTFRTQRNLRVLFRATLAFAFILGVSGTASAFSGTNRVVAYTSWKNQFFWVDSSGNGYFRLAQGSGATQAFWTFAQQILTVEDAVNINLDNVATVTAACNGFVVTNGSNWSGNGWNDDLFHASAAFSRAYLLTGNTNFRTIAKNGFDAAYSRGYDPTDGGIWENTSNNAKSSIATETCAYAAYLLYQALGDSSYLTKAQAEYSYIKTYDMNLSTGEVYISKSDTTDFPSIADAGMVAIMGTYLNDPTTADLVANWVPTWWTTPALELDTAIDSDAGPANGIALRGLTMTGQNLGYWQAACDRAWSYRNSYNLTNQNWTTTTPSTYNLYCQDTMSMPTGMVNVPVVVINSASYVPVDGFNAGSVVTSIIAGDVNKTNGSLAIGVQFSNLGGDPAPGHVKQLSITCTVGGNQETISANDGGTINIMNVLNGPGTVVSATFLPVDGSNAGSNVISHFSSSVFNMPINYSTLGDPAPGHVKELKMVYSVSGQSETVIVPENSVLNLYDNSFGLSDTYKISSAGTPGFWLQNTNDVYNGTAFVDHVAATPTSSNNPQQVWQLALQSNGYYLVTDGSQALQLTSDVYNTGSTTVPGCYNVVATPTSWNIGQQFWSVVSQGGGNYKIVSASNSALCLQITGNTYYTGSGYVSGCYNVAATPVSWNYGSQVWQLTN